MQEQTNYLNHWRKITEQKFGWEDSAEWTEYDFEKLSDTIFEKAGVRLSISTLKRVWGRVRYDSNPSITTLNALAVFAGYENWRYFKQYIDQTNQKPAGASNVQVKKRFWMPYLPIMLCVLALSFITLMIFFGKSKGRQIVKPKQFIYQFLGHVVADNLPNSVVFDYRAGDQPKDAVYIQQSWDPERTERIPSKGRQHTSIYYYPGYFGAKLLVNGKIKKETPVYIQTKGWVATIDRKPIPIYLNKTDMFSNRGLGVSPQTLTKLINTSVFNGQLTEFFNVKKFGVDGGNFTFTISLSNTSSLQQSACRKVVIAIFGTENAIVIPLAAEGCTSDIGLYTSSEWLIGKNYDLSAFGCDFSKFQQLSCKVQHKEFSIILNGKTILTRLISQTIGEIVGVNIAFEGSGEIKNIYLSNNHRTIYQEQFGKEPH